MCENCQIEIISDNNSGQRHDSDGSFIAVRFLSLVTTLQNKR